MLIAQNGLCDDDTIYINITVLDPVGLFENTTGISVFPNPFTNQIQVKGIHNATYKILDLTGKLIQQGVTKGNIYTTSEMSAGIYLLVIQDGENLTRLKLEKL